MTSNPEAQNRLRSTRGFHNRGNGVMQSIREQVAPGSRFPPDFANWRSQIVISNPGANMGLRRTPYAFTEQGVAMLRAFVQLRELMLTHLDLARKLDELEKRYRKHEQHFTVVFDAIRQLLEPLTEENKSRIGFRI